MIDFTKKRISELFEENKRLKEALERERKTVKKYLKRKYIIEQTGSEQSEEEELPVENEEIIEEQPVEIKENKEKVVEQKAKTKIRSRRKRKQKSYSNT